jgi:N-acyl-D-amino-acid deacylase
LHSKTIAVAGTVLWLLAGHAGAHAQKPPMPPDFNALTRQAIQKSLPLLQASATTFTTKQTCISCHHQSLPTMALAMAREKGFKFDLKQAQAQSDRVYNTIAMMRPLIEQAKTSPKAEKQIDTLVVDPPATVGYVLAGLDADKRKPDALLGMTARYLAKKQSENGSWRALYSRPPLEGSDFTVTALAVRAIQTYSTPEVADETKQRVEKARAWLLAAAPKTHEDKVFRLFGLRWANAAASDIRKAADDLIADQQDDGGWAQMPGLETDPYATGQALVALHQAGNLPVTDPVYTKGKLFLLMAQKEDGSWFVKKRTMAAQVYFDSGYPHAGSQFISIAGASWATMALALSVEPTTQAASAAPPAAARTR